MSISKIFIEFLENIKVKNTEKISNRYEEITKVLNKKYRNTDSKIANTLQVGSYGRKTAINGISDLDMIYILPYSIFERFKKRQSALLQDIKTTLKNRYPKTNIKGDGQVVVVSFSNYQIEILPSFELSDGSFKYPDTNKGGSWKITKPRKEIKAISILNNSKNSNLRPLCKIIRAWKNHNGLNIGGLLIDTLVYNFLKSTTKYDSISYLNYDKMLRDFFKYISELPKQDYLFAPGSNQKVYVKCYFQKKAKLTYNICLDAIKLNDYNIWKKIFGYSFPTIETYLESTNIYWKDTEEFIEDKYQIDIKYSIYLECEVSQDGFLKHTLTEMIYKKIPLLPSRKLLFIIKNINIDEPFEVKWKVLNQGRIAKERDNIRGQIINGTTKLTRKEVSTFLGNHKVECYIIKNNIIIARNKIDVPITTRG